MIHLKYFKARSKHRDKVLSEYSSVTGKRISPYDDVIKKESERLSEFEARVDMNRREMEFVKYIEEGKKKYRCDLVAKLEICGAAFSTEVLAVAHQMVVPAKPAPKAPGTGRKRSRRKRK